MSGPRVLVLQHIACEPPGVYEDVLLERGASIRRIELDEGEALPGLDGVDAIVAMGGPMSVNDEARHPWLVAEKRLIADAVDAGTPFFGACLGVQLFAASLGASVTSGGIPEVGVLPVFATDAAVDDPVFSGLAWPRPTLQWHSDTFALPEGATLLATSPAYPHQAFRVGERAYGVQFHLEVTEEMADEWARVPEYVVAAERALGPGGLGRLLDEFRASAKEMRADARTLFSRWVDLWAPATRERAAEPEHVDSGYGRGRSDYRR
jgi:GMP synthase (glutamine-hydrolysing)